MAGCVIDYTDESYPKCSKCKAFLYYRRGGTDDNGVIICTICATPKAVGVNPLPEHMQREVEPYIQWRCDMAVAQFVLEQAERINGKEKAA